MKNSPQADLFGDSQAAAHAESSADVNQTAAMISIAPSSAGLNAQQAMFNKLSAEIEAERANLSKWQAFSSTFGVKLEQEYDPAQAKLHASKRRFVILADQVFQESLAKGGKKLTKKRKYALQDLIVSIIAGLDSEQTGTSDDVLDALFERYTGFSAAEHREIAMAEVESFLIDELGIESVRGHSAESVEDLLMHAREKMAQADAKRSENRESRRAERHEKSGRISPAAARKAAAEQDMKKTVRDIYRKLASDLHPDREPDLAERARKTALMQRINAAYESDNLLELLTLQMEVAQLSSAALSAIPAERLKNFIQVLNQQLKTLKAEVRGICQRFGSTFNLPPNQYPKTIEAVNKIFTAKISDLQRINTLVEDDCDAIVDLTQRDRCIDRLM